MNNIRYRLFAVVLWILSSSIPVGVCQNTTRPKPPEQLLQQAKNLFLPEEADSSVLYALQAEQAFEKLNRPEAQLEALAYLVRGYVVTSDDKNRDQYFDKALSLSKKHQLDSSEYVGNIYLTLGAYYSIMGYVNESWDLIQKAEAIYRKHYGANRIEMAELYMHIAGYYVGINESNKAIENFTTALNICLALCENPNLLPEETNYINDYLLRTIHNNLAATYLGLGKTKEVKKHLAHSLYYLEAACKPDSTAFVEYYNHLGMANTQSDDYQTALVYYNQAYNLIQRHAYANPTAAAGVLGNIAEVYMLTGDYSRAIFYMKQSVKESQSHHWQPGVALGKLLLDRMFNQLGQPDSAKKYFSEKEFLEIARPFPIFMVQFYGLKGLSAFQQQNYTEAIHQFRNQLDMALTFIDAHSNNLVTCYINLGYSHLKILNFDSTFHYFFLALKDLKVDPDLYEKGIIPPLYKVVSLSQFLLTTEHLANAYRYQAIDNDRNVGMWKKSLQAHKFTLAIMDSARSRFREDMSRIELANTYHHIYENGLESAWELYNLTGDAKYIPEAWPFMEKSKNSLLLSGIRASEISFSDSGMRKAIEMNLDHESLYSQIQQAEARGDSEGKSRLYDQYAQQNSTNQKSAYINRIFNPSTISFDSAQNMLDSNQAYLAYFWGEDEVYLLALNKTDSRLITFFIDTTLVEYIRNMQAYTQYYNPDSSKVDWPLYYEMATYLYAKLIAPVADMCRNKELIISPSGALSNIPFEAFIDNEPPFHPQAPASQYPFLIKQYPVSYTFSASIFAENRRKSRRYYFPSILGIAPINFREQSDLVYSSKSMEEITKYFKVKSLTGENATIKSFKKQSNRHPIWYFATHGSIDKDFPLNSAILFGNSPIDSTSNQFYLKEIYGFPCSPELVVLSACQTAEGPEYRGEGVISIGRGFTYAGAKSVVMSLWKLSDEKTVSLMTDFYRNLAKGMKKSEALQIAKRNFIENGFTEDVVPYYWAGMVQYGETESIKKTVPLWAVLYGSVFVLLLLALFGFRRRLFFFFFQK